MHKVLHLVIPGLPRSAGSAARLLKRASVETLDAAGREAALFWLFGLPAAGDLPVAALTRLADGGPVQGGWWLRADPVQLYADLRQVLLFAPSSLEPAEANALAAAFNDTFGADGLILEALHPERWYLRLAEDPGLHTCPVTEAIGRDVGSLLPKGPAGPRWHALLTEIQMLFHDHPVNQAREARGRTPVNSVWFWGGGELPQGAKSPAEGIYANDPLTRGLARLAGAAVGPVPDNAADWQEAAAGEASSLVVLDAGSDDIDALEQHWLAPCLAMVRSGIKLYLYPGDGRRYDISRGDLWRFWRRMFR